MGFNKRKWWYLKNNRSISIEISGCMMQRFIFGIQ